MRVFVNGKAYEISVEGSCTLLTLLRDRLHLTGTKNGCGKGDCGACTVLVDGKPVRACITPVRKIEGKAIETIEGLGTLRRLHPLQTAFLKSAAVQCGFCTPGMILRAKALLDRNSSPGSEDIKEALATNLCRCTGYQPIVDAVLLAAKALRGEITLDLKSLEAPGIGSNVVGPDSIEKVRGTAKYGADFYIEGMLIVGVVRSPHHHARILNIDTSQAKKVEGVELVITSKDIPGVNRTGTTSLKDQPVLAEGKVRYLGEPVVAIAARDPRALKQAMGKVNISFEELAPVFSPNDALSEGHVAVHDSGNLVYSREIVHGDVQGGFEECDIIVEEEFSTGLVEHAYIEPEAGIAYKKGDAIYIHTGGQDVHFYQAEIARVLGLKDTEWNRLRIIQVPTGGGFGGKIDLSVQGILALLAAKTDKALKYSYSREESFLSSPKRHPFTVFVKVGAKKNGRLHALRVSLLADTGAYSSWGRGVLNRAAVHATGPYEIPHVFVEGRLVYTNNPVSGAFRGFGVPQATFAIESALDILAERLKIDPFRLREINVIKEGSVTATGQRLERSIGIGKCMAAVAPYYHKERAKVKKTPFNESGPVTKLGIGVANMWFGIGYTGMPNPADATVELRRNGKFCVYTGACDIGQGSNTVLWQIAAEALAVPLENVHFVSGDTRLTSNTNITCASRQTHFSGNAIKNCAATMREMIIKLVSELFGEMYVEDIFWENGAYRTRKDPGRKLSLKEVYIQLKMRNLPTKISRVFYPDIKKLDEKGQGIPYSSYAFATQLAVVEVNLTDKSIRVLRFVAAHDVGRAINRIKVEGQITGGIVMGMGYALSEEFISGKTNNYRTYKIPTIVESPKITPILVEETDPSGPFGAKGVGEPALVATAPAIANAIFDAVAFRPKRLPINLSHEENFGNQFL